MPGTGLGYLDSCLLGVFDGIFWCWIFVDGDAEMLKPGVSRRLRQMIQLMPQLSFLSSVEDSCSGSKSSLATACDASPCAPLYTIAELV